MADVYETTSSTFATSVTDRLWSIQELIEAAIGIESQIAGWAAKIKGVKLSLRLSPWQTGLACGVGTFLAILMNQLVFGGLNHETLLTYVLVFLIVDAAVFLVLHILFNWNKSQTTGSTNSN
ncbi:MAG: hypothetical protein ACREQI_06655 [Candidatus Binataceae bacterium]